MNQYFGLVSALFNFVLHNKCKTLKDKVFESRWNPSHHTIPPKKQCINLQIRKKVIPASPNL
jgi:hypothetical protein